MSDYKGLIKLQEKDYERIITTDDTNAWHEEDVFWLKQEIERAKSRDEDVCVLTHHSPLVTGTSKPEHIGTPCNTAFTTDLKYMMGGNLKLWAFGHTHHNCDVLCKGTRVVSNQHGYGGPDPTFDPMFCCEI
ncbi:hypothetical protein AKO1_000134 [Acrasis kona]|uniref:Calcineurin-like phosphoesterase domain-containing protein n=1 Tax=Acrasis kona TaxID=1008807 RepID=A0AAW2ZG79_9EUKA